MPADTRLLDISSPSMPRVHDYWAGGKDHFAADRALGDELLAICPGMRAAVLAGRAFTSVAAARAAGGAGITAFLDLGCGFPGPLPLIASLRPANPSVRVACVDRDPVVLLHAGALLASPGVTVTGADLTSPADVLDAPGVRDVVRAGEPACVILGQVAHRMDAATVRETVAGYMSRLAPGSWLVMSMVRHEDPVVLDRLRGAWPGVLHDHDPVTFGGFLGGMDLVPPGVSEARRWIGRIRSPLPSCGSWAMCAAGVKRRLRPVPRGYAGRRRQHREYPRRDRQPDVPHDRLAGTQQGAAGGPGQGTIVARRDEPPDRARDDKREPHDDKVIPERAHEVRLALTA